MNPRVFITSQHPKQKAVFDARQRFVIAVCGRRFGKTVIGIERALRNMRRKKFRGWIIAPTRQMVKDLYWEPLKERAERLHWKVRKNETDLVLERLSTGARYTLLSGDRPERLRGRGLDDVIGDEWADMDGNLFPEIIRPALIDRRGTALLVGTPAGRNHLFELWNGVEHNPEWARFQFKTIDNPYLPADEIAAARATMDERTARQELEADFVEYLGAAYHYHDRAVHRVERPFNHDAPIVVCADFNIDPCIWELAQPLTHPVECEYFFDEICQRNTVVWRMCAETQRRIIALFSGDEMRARQHPLKFYGDYTSNKRRDVTAVDSAWGIIRSQFDGWNTEFNLKNNPRVVDRLNAMNGLMRGADGVVRMGYSARCVELGKDFDMCSADDVLRKGAVGDRTHASDAAGYYVEWEHPVIRVFGRQWVD